MFIDLEGYRAATPEEEAELAIWAQAAARYRAAFEARGVVGQEWNKLWRDSDFSYWRVLQTNISARRAAIDAAADGEAVEVAVPNVPEGFTPCRTQVILSEGSNVTLWDSPVYLTTSQVKLRAQAEDVSAQVSSVYATVGGAIGSVFNNKHAGIQIGEAAGNVGRSVVLAKVEAVRLGKQTAADLARELEANAVGEEMPDVKALAENRAQNIRDSRREGGKPPTATAVVLDTATGKVYAGDSGAKPRDIHPDLKAKMPAASLEKWPVENCAEFDAVNKALWEGARIQDLEVYTVRVKSGQPFPRCRNCQSTTSGATVRSE